MKVYRISELTGRTRSKELPITEEQYYRFMCNIDQELPQLDDEQMRFLMTGVVAEELSCPSDQNTR